MTDALSIWTVYDHPADFPHSFVARRSEVRKGETVMCGDAIIGATLDLVREELMHRGLICMTRHPDDDPVIVETWL